MEAHNRCEEGQDIMGAYNETVMDDVARIVNKKTALSDETFLSITYAEQFNIAREKELAMIEKHKVFGDEVSIREAANKFPDAAVVDSHFIYTIKDVKGAGTKFKVRLVADGHRVRGMDGWPVKEKIRQTPKRKYDKRIRENTSNRKEKIRLTEQRKYDKR
eukprot:Lankesteria_metandrocarpae@DN812_c0_g1_i1.p1